MSSAIAEKTVTHLQLKTAAITLFVALSTVLVFRVILPSLFDLDEATRTLLFSRVNGLYIVMAAVAIGGSIKRLKEWSFGKTLLIVWVCTTVGSLIMGLGIIIDI